jgi:hypothetical protein
VIAPELEVRDGKPPLMMAQAAGDSRRCGETTEMGLRVANGQLKLSRHLAIFSLFTLACERLIYWDGHDEKGTQIWMHARCTSDLIAGLAKDVGSAVVRVVTILDLLPITIIDLSHGLQRAAVPLTSSLLSRIAVPFPLVFRRRNGERSDDLAQTLVDHGTSLCSSTLFFPCFFVPSVDNRILASRHGKAGDSERCSSPAKRG